MKAELAYAEAGARAAPGAIAQAIIDGRDLVLLAAEGLAHAALDPLVQKAKIDEIRKQMADILGATGGHPASAASQRNATEAGLRLQAAQQAYEKKATAAHLAALMSAQDAYQKARAASQGTAGKAMTDQQKLDYATLEIQLAGYLLRADPMSKEAAGLLAKYLKSSDPATQAAMQALADALGLRVETLKLNVEQIMADTGLTFPAALQQALQPVADAAQGLRLRMAKELALDATDIGGGVATTWLDGLIAALAAGLTGQTYTWIQKYTKLLGGVQPFSPPPPPGKPVTVPHQVPTFDAGSWSVPQTGLALVHRQELIMPNPLAAAFRAFMGGG